MEYLKLQLSPPPSSGYDYKDASNVAMCILDYFLASDVRSNNSTFYKEWALDKNTQYTGGNITALEKEDGYVLISDLYPIDEEEKNPTIVKMTEAQFVQLLEDWEKVYKTKPQEIMIIYENDTYTINVVQ
jgi:hypothetical protein